MVCVPLYMLLSGYLSAEKHIPLTRPDLLGYYKKLLPIFLTYALSTGVILLYRVLWLGEEQTIRSAVKNLLSFQQYSWYMNMYFGLLLLTPFLNALWQSLATPAARRALLAVLLVLTVLPGMVNIYHLHNTVYRKRIVISSIVKVKIKFNYIISFARSFSSVSSCSSYRSIATTCIKNKTF